MHRAQLLANVSRSPYLDGVVSLVCPASLQEEQLLSLPPTDGENTDMPPLPRLASDSVGVVDGDILPALPKMTTVDEGAAATGSADLAAVELVNVGRSIRAASSVQPANEDDAASVLSALPASSLPNSPGVSDLPPLPNLDAGKDVTVADMPPLPTLDNVAKDGSPTPSLSQVEQAYNMTVSPPDSPLLHW